MATIPEKFKTLLSAHYPILDFDGVFTLLDVNWEVVKDELKLMLNAPTAQHFSELYYYALYTNQKDVYLKINLRAETDSIRRAQASPIVDFLQQQRCRFSILSKNNSQVIQYFLKTHGLSQNCDRIVGIDTVREIKPHPEGLFQIIDAIKPHRPLYIGDQFSDRLTALAGKIPYEYYRYE